MKGIIKTLNKAFPHGHKDFIPMSIEEMELHSKKNFKYAFGGDPLGNFDRVSTIMAQYPKVNWATRLGVDIIYSLKQLDAVLWMMNSGHSADALEGIGSCLEDVSVYAKLGRIIHKESVS